MRNITVIVTCVTASFCCNAFLAPATVSRTVQHKTSSLGVSTAPTSESDTTQSGPAGGAEDALLTVAQSHLIGSNLVYTYAELRQLSYCGYTKTKFKELDSNRWKHEEFSSRRKENKGVELVESTRGITPYKLFEVLIREGDSIMKEKGMGSIIQKEKLVGLRKILPETVESKRGQEDLDNLKKTLDITVSDYDKNVAPSFVVKEFEDDESDNALEKAAGAVAKLLEPKSDEYPDTADEKLIELVEGFKDYFLNLRPQLLSEMMRQDMELIYFGDKYPQKDCVYGIIVNRTKKRVTVIFRGSVNLNDWWSNIQVQQEEVDNPAYSLKDGDDDEQPEKLGIHKGFYAFLRRGRRDRFNSDGSPRTKFDRILDRVTDYTRNEREQWKDDWKLCVSGHSLGGALATLFGFYAATDKRIYVEREPVEVFTFASPFVGDYRFRQAFKGLERDGKIVHARVSNDNDFVTMLPFLSPKFNPEHIFNFKEWDFSWYKHVGLQLFLKSDKHGGEPLEVSYPFKEDFVSEILRTFKCNVVFSLPHLFQALDTHMPPEYRNRLKRAIEKEEERLSVATQDEKENSLLNLSLKDCYAQGETPIVNDDN